MSSRDIIAVCQQHITAYRNDCAAFVLAVAGSCGVPLVGDANAIASSLNQAQGRLTDGVSAARAAAKGLLVFGGMAEPGHGHVVVVVEGPLNRGRYPYAFWGQYHGVKYGGQIANVGFSIGHGTVNWAFRKEALEKVVYAAYTPSALMTPKAGALGGRILYTFT